MVNTEYAMQIFYLIILHCVISVQSNENIFNSNNYYTLNKIISMTKWVNIKKNFQQLSNSTLKFCFYLAKQEILSRLNTSFLYTSSSINRLENQTISRNESFTPAIITLQRERRNLSRNNTLTNIEFESVRCRSIIDIQSNVNH
jgi:hypothetical protein